MHAGPCEVSVRCLNCGVADIFLGLAAAVVKAGVQIWLKDDPWAADASAPVADLVGVKVSGDLEQRKARRFFEDLEVPVAKRLRVLRKTEFGRLPRTSGMRPSWRPAAVSTVPSLGQKISSRVIWIRFSFSSTNGPAPVRRHETCQRPDSLDDRLIAEGCAYVIEIAESFRISRRGPSRSCWTVTGRSWNASTRLPSTHTGPGRRPVRGCALCHSLPPPYRDQA